MVQEQNWSEKYLHSDHHTDRLVFNKIHSVSKLGGLIYPDAKEYLARCKLGRVNRSNCQVPVKSYTCTANNNSTSTKSIIPSKRTRQACIKSSSRLTTIPEDSEHQPTTNMARGRGGFDVTVKKRAQSVPVGDFNEPSAYRQTQYISRGAVDDMDNVSHASRKQDQKLLDDITSRLCKFEFDCVKPGRQVASKTGFRRHLYGKKPLVERETRTQRRKEELMYPWDYTFDNIYRAREKRPWTKKAAVKEPPKRSKWDDTPDVLPEKIYPDQYPYKERVRRQRKDPDSITLTGKRFENMGTHELLAKMKGKLEAKPRGRSAGVDVDILLEGLHHPLPRSYVKGQCFTAVDDWEGSSSSGDKLEGDPVVNKKVADSKKELADFERLLEDRFKRRKDCFVSRAPPKPVRLPTPPPQDDEEKLAQIEVNASFTQPPVTVKRSRGRAVVRDVPAVNVISSARAAPRHRLPRAVRDILADTSDEYDFPASPRHRSSGGAGRFAGRSAGAAAERRRAASVPPPSVSSSSRRGPITVHDPRNDFITYGSPLMKPAGRTPEERKLGEFKASLQYRFFMPDNIDDVQPPRKQPKRSNTYSYTTAKDKMAAPAPRSYYRTAAPRTSSSYTWRASSEPPARPEPRAYPRPVYTTHTTTASSGVRAHRPVPGMTPSTDLAVRQARATLGRLEREWGYDEDDLDAGYTTPITHVPSNRSYRTVQHTYSPVFTGASPASSPAPVRRTRAYRSNSVCYGSPVTTTSYTSSPVTTRRSHRAADLELKMAMAASDESPYPDLARLRTLHSGAKDKMDRYKTSLDRYLPVYMGPVNDVPVEVEYKYDELKNRMPSLDPYRAGGGSSTGTHYVPPYKPAAVSQNKPSYPSDGRPPPAWKPRVSDTRRRCREVLSKSKGDPGYYDY